MSESELYKSLPTFNADLAKWPNFHYKLRLHLEGRGLLTIIDDSAPVKGSRETDDDFATRSAAWKRDDAKVRGIITNKLSDEILPMVKDLKTAAAMVNLLKEQFESTSIASRIELLDRLLDLKYEPGEEIATHIGKVG
ncbi:hypothetical protein HDU96_004006, partial [Phlyctochytrium bullatum]